MRVMWNHRRTHMSPIGRGPWLDDYSNTRACQWTIGVGGILFLVTALLINAGGGRHTPSYAHPSAWLFFFFGVSVLMMGFGSAWWGVFWIRRRRVQTCPACLSGMTRGATTCPHCQFHAPQETP